jgi:hypothetical protein
VKVDFVTSEAAALFVGGCIIYTCYRIVLGTGNMIDRAQHRRAVRKAPKIRFKKS